MSALARYFHTLRHLRLIQIAGRARLVLSKPRSDLRAAPERRLRTAAYVAPIAQNPTLVGPDTFRFLNVERHCATGQDWSPRDATRLWTYHLHYFDDLNSRDAASRYTWHVSLLRRWVAENPPGQGTGWEPYPLSRRLVNCVKWALAGNNLPPECLTSLATQSRWLTRRLEYHLMGNHLFANAKALVYAGLYFAGAEADGWYERGMRILEEQLAEQILSDGGHFERSPMYHAATLEDLLDLSNILTAYGRNPPHSWSSKRDDMRRWLHWMCHPDGGIAFFNDAAFDGAPSAREIELYCERLGLPSPAREAPRALEILQPSGYVRMTMVDALLICDCAPVGPDYLPGHAHADTLSFEMSIAEQRIFVNSGTSEYGVTAERHRQRGTAAHNTVVIDGKDSSEVWAGFRVARRARVRWQGASATAAAVTARASHTGYHRLPGHNEHVRSWRLEREQLLIEDEILGRCGHAEAYFHLHPNVTARVSSSHEVLLAWPGGAAQISFGPEARVELRPDTWHPQFGVAVENRCVVARFGAAMLQTRISFGKLSP